MSGAASSNPFSARAAIALVLFGAVVFVIMLWMIGAGRVNGPLNDGGGHAGGRGLNGYAAFYQFLEKRGHGVRFVRAEAAHKEGGLLVLTPPLTASAEDVTEILERHWWEGPTLLILPKWTAMPVPAALQADRAKPGWVILGSPRTPGWADDVDYVGPVDLQTDSLEAGQAQWRGYGLNGAFPESESVQTMSSDYMVSLVTDGRGRVLAGRLVEEDDEDEGGYPVVIVAEPDLLNNYGFARQEQAMLADALVRDIVGEDNPVVSFDLTLNGHGRSANLLTLAFTPPFLAATLCLLLAAIVVGWRAFLRFGPPRKAQRAIAFGKAALVANTAGFIRRTRRLHLISYPYADRARERLVRDLALPRQTDDTQTEAAIDRALAARVPGGPSFTKIAARLRMARNRHELLKAAQELNALERTLKG